MPCDGLFLHQPDAIISANVYKSATDPDFGVTSPSSSAVDIFVETEFGGTEAKTLAVGDVLLAGFHLFTTSTSYTVTPATDWVTVLNVRASSGSTTWIAAKEVASGDLPNVSATFTVDLCTHVKIMETPILRQIDIDQATWYSTQSQQITPTRVGTTLQYTGTSTFDVGDFADWAAAPGDVLVSGAVGRQVVSTTEDFSPPHDVMAGSSVYTGNSPGGFDSPTVSPMYYGLAGDLPNDPTWSTTQVQSNVGAATQMHWGVLFRARCGGGLFVGKVALGAGTLA